MRSPLGRFRWILFILAMVVGAGGLVLSCDLHDTTDRIGAPATPGQPIGVPATPDQGRVAAARPVEPSTGDRLMQSDSDQATVKYLGFQIFVGEQDPSAFLGTSQLLWTQRHAASGAVGGAPLSRPPSKRVLAAFGQGIIDRIGSTGQGDRRLTLIFGPLAFDQTDEDIARLVHDVFDIAIEKNVPVGFHIDDSKFWSRRSDLWRNPGNVEWLDWNRTPSRGMRLTWGEPAPKLAPPMCFNAKPIVAEVQRQGRDVIGRAIKQGIDRLNALGKPELFSVVIMGWETSIGRDYDNSRQPLGYCALTNRGFSGQNPPSNFDSELESVVHDFIVLWAKSLVDAGIPREKMFAHVPFLNPANLDQARRVAGFPPDQTYSQMIGFAPLRVTFNNPYLSPGISYYGEGHAHIIGELRSGGITRWASAEGVNVHSNISMEMYLAQIFNNGGVLANLFGWGVGPNDPRNPFRHKVEGPPAIRAYNKFLSGATLAGR